MKKYYDTTIEKEHLEMLTWINRVKFAEPFVKSFKKILFTVSDGFYTEKEAFLEAQTCGNIFQKKGILGLYQDTLCMTDEEEKNYVQDAIVIYLNEKNVMFEPEE